MHDAHGEVGLGQGADIEPLQEKAADVVGEGTRERGDTAVALEPSTTSRHDQGEVIPPSLGRSTQTSWVIVLLAWSCPPHLERD